MQILIVIAMLSLAQAPAPQTLRFEAGMTRPVATISDLGWLEGTWSGEGFGGAIDEVFTAPAGGAMVGLFRLVREGKPIFYEILTVLEHEGSLEMRLKHVNPDMTGWEEKNNFLTFKLVKIDETGAYFSGFTFKRLGPDRLEGFLAMRGPNGTPREERFTFRRVR